MPTLLFRIENHGATVRPLLASLASVVLLLVAFVMSGKGKMSNLGIFGVIHIINSKTWLKTAVFNLLRFAYPQDEQRKLAYPNNAF
jgi:hypothetical protein